MRQYGKNRDDLRKAISALDDPMVANTLGRLPGMTDTLKSLGAKLLDTSQETVPSAPVHPPQMSDDIMSRLARLR